MHTSPLRTLSLLLGLSACAPNLDGDWSLNTLTEDQADVPLIEDSTGPGTLIHVERTGTLTVDADLLAVFTFEEQTTYTLDDPDVTTEPRTNVRTDTAEGAFEPLDAKRTYAVLLEGHSDYTLSCTFSGDLLDCTGVKDDTDPNTSPADVQLNFSRD